MTWRLLTGFGPKQVDLSLGIVSGHKRNPQPPWDPYMINNCIDFTIFNL